MKLPPAPHPAILAAGLLCVSPWLRAAEPVPGARAPVDPFVEERNRAYATQLEKHLLNWLVDAYPERARRAWARDYSGLEAFERSVAPNRDRWRAILAPPPLQKTGGLARRPHPPLADLQAEWIALPLGGLVAEGVLVFPAGASPQSRVPLIIAQHGIGSTPETPFSNPTAGYHAYARELLQAGFAGLAPFNLRSVPSRNRIERLARLADTSLPGIEFSRLQHLLDVVLAEPRIDRDRVGMWGVSLGGMATLFFMPLEPRIKVGVVSAWFNHRISKMAISDRRYSTFLDTQEGHAFFRGWLTEFTDSDALALICPRPILVQHGKRDQIAYWPDLLREFEAARTHYERLGIAGRIGLDLHEGRHEARPDTGIPFLQRWLTPSGDAAGRVGPTDQTSVPVIP
ncbi:MAG: hypothetical protein HZC55_18815 [Verrucomicrobia bacterium]|nr:hypothetical protein [Verrucomicrobiota bacterium]